VLDPTHLESLLCNGTITLTLNAQQEICVLSKAGGVPLPADDIMKVVTIAVQRVKEVDALIKKALDKATGKGKKALAAAHDYEG
jgi:exosome complex component RRP45